MYTYCFILKKYRLGGEREREGRKARGREGGKERGREKGCLAQT